jgi:hypothetical protein
MKLPWISRRAAAEQLARELQRRAAELRTAADARITAIAQERDWLRQRNEQLVDVIIAFKRDGYGVPTKNTVRQAPDVEANVLERIEGGLTKAFLANAKRDLIEKTGISPTEAEREARRLRDEAVSEHPAEG